MAFGATPGTRHRRRLRHRLSALAMLLLPAACAAPVPPPEPPLPYPPAARERMLRIAVAEWRDWGSQVVDAGATPRPPSAQAETRPENFPRVLAYWRAVEDDEGAVATNRPLYRAALAGRPEGRTLWQQPFWSAAFVSYVMRSAGVDRAEFPPAPAHATYVDAMIANATRFPATAPFLPYGPAERAPQPGDMVCADRGGNSPITHWRQRAADAGKYRPMHCDIVVRTAPGVVEAIGGNVLDAVTLSRFPADAAGYLLPRGPGAPVWFAVFENRLGCLPPWGPCPPGAAPSAAPIAAPRGGPVTTTAAAP
jgi:hypothetical protein